MPSRPTPVLAVLVILLAIAVRLPGIGNPPQDIHHVRQSDTSSIARNMAREGIDLLHPRIDWAGANAGTVESELPLYNAIVAAGWPSTGSIPRSGYMWARAVSIAAWAIGALALLLWVRRRLPGPALIYLAVYLLSPLGIAFSRNIQPDALAVALMLLALERADAASDRPGAWGSIVAAGVLGALAIATKGTTAFFVAMIPLLLMRAGGPGVAGATTASALAVLPAAAWFWHAHATLGADGASFGLWGGEVAKWGSFGVWLDPATWRSIGGTLVVHAATPLGLGAALVGASQVRHEPELRPFVLALGAAALSAVLVAQGFRIHNYYQLTWIPFLSVVAGAGTLELVRMVREEPRRGQPALAVGLAVALGGWSALAGRTFVEDATKIDVRINATAPAVSAFVPPGGAVIVVDRHPQSLLYAMDRRGFHRTGITMSEVLSLKEIGAEYIYVSGTAPGQGRGLLPQLNDSEQALARGADWLLFRLRDAPEPEAAPLASGSAGDDDDSAR